MEDDKKIRLTIQGFKEYLAFYDQNQVLKLKFVVSERIDFGLWDTKSSNRCKITSARHRLAPLFCPYSNRLAFDNIIIQKLFLGHLLAVYQIEQRAEYQIPHFFNVILYS